MSPTLKNIIKSPYTWIAIAVILLILLVRKKSEAAILAGVPVAPVDSTYNVRPLVDLIYSKVAGINFLYYPEIINALADLSDEKLAEAYNYWQQKYSGAMGGDTLTAALQNEGHGGMYDPAIGRLESLNLF